MEFGWDPRKARSNLAKHGVSFDEAKTVFDDELFLAFSDPDHSTEESRFIIMGRSEQGRLLIGPTGRDPIPFASSALEKQPAESERLMPKTSNRKMRDELRPEYDFRALRVVARGPGRKTSAGITVCLAPDVAQTFPDSDAVNETLRLLIRIAKTQVNTGNRSTQAGGRISNEASHRAAQRSAPPLSAALLASAHASSPVAA